MKTYVWKKEQIEGKWYSVCKSHEHVPLIRWNSDGTYAVKDSNGKPRIERDWKSAQKFAIEVYKKFCKFNKTFES